MITLLTIAIIILVATTKLMSLGIIKVEKKVEAKEEKIHTRSRIKVTHGGKFQAFI